MKTKNGIELDLSKSKYIYVYKDLKFFFSSELYLKKFTEQIHEFILLENIKINNKYKVRINLSEYLAISLYRKIEKRGSLIKYLNQDIENCYISISID